MVLQSVNNLQTTRAIFENKIKFSLKKTYNNAEAFFICKKY